MRLQRLDQALGSVTFAAQVYIVLKSVYVLTCCTPGRVRAVMETLLTTPSMTILALDSVMILFSKRWDR